MSSINPYLAFKGNCEEAFNFYRSVFGGEYDLRRFKDMPSSDNYSVPDEEKNLVMHVSFPIGNTVLMGSDTPSHYRENIKTGSNFSISVATESEDQTNRVFNGLAEGGQVTMPVQKTFWNAYFGMCTDKFGIQWMVNSEIKGS